MHRRSFASEGTLPKATRRERKLVRGNAEAWVSTLQKCRVVSHFDAGPGYRFLVRMRRVWRRNFSPGW